MAPVFASKLPLLKQLSAPIDGRRHWRGQRLLGENKTIRGYVAAIVMGAMTTWLQRDIFGVPTQLQPLFPLSYYEVNSFLLGGLLGLGAILGDSVKSFFKRQRQIPPGSTWFFFDQVDYVLGGILFSLPVVALPAPHYLSILFVFFIFHIVVTHIGYYLHLKSSPL